MVLAALEYHSKGFIHHCDAKRMPFLLGFFQAYIEVGAYGSVSTCPALYTHPRASIHMQ